MHTKLSKKLTNMHAICLQSLNHRVISSNNVSKTSVIYDTLKQNTVFEHQDTHTTTIVGIISVATKNTILVLVSHEKQKE